MQTVEELYAKYFTLTADAVAASNLVIAQAILGDGKAGAPLTVVEAARFLGISPNTIYDMVQSGKLPSIRLGVRKGSIRIHKEDLIKLERESTTEAKPDESDIFNRMAARKLGKP